MPFSTQRTSPSPSSRLGGGGLDYITSSTFTTASTVSVDGCFTSTYENYVVAITQTGSSGGVDVSMRMRVSGTDASGATDYVFNAIYSTHSAGPTRSYSSTSSWPTGHSSDQAGAHLITLYSPALAVRTRMIGDSSNWSSASAIKWSVSGQHGLTTAYDGFTIYPASGTITGTITVFGYRKA